MQEQGFINRNVADIIASLGHLDEMLVTDAGFPIPAETRAVDLSWSVNQPIVPDLLKEIVKVFSVERVVVATEFTKANPKRFKEISAIFGPNVPIDTIPHAELKIRSKSCKGIVRSGDFTGYSNILLVSGGGDRWFSEQD